MRGGVLLQPRDHEILEALREWGALDAETVTRRWFTSRDKSRKRMMRLLHEGLCRRMLVARNVPAVYYVGAFTAQTLHRAAVNSVRVALWEHGRLVEFLPEVEFEGSQHRADALVVWEPRGGEERVFFLEVDRGTESAVQVRAKMRGYEEYYRSMRWRQRWGRFPPILWFAAPARLNQLARWIKRANLPADMRNLYGLQDLTASE